MIRSTRSIRRLALTLVAGVAGGLSAAADTQWLDQKLHHLRAVGEPEWTDFPANAEGPALRLKFHAPSKPGPQTLRVRQQDVKQAWRVLVNDKEVGRLALDENDTVVYFAIPSDRLVSGENTLSIEQVGKVIDDIRVGEIAIDVRPLREVLSEATVEVRVLDATPPGDPRPTPCRLTILNAEGALFTTSAVTNDTCAVRPGVVYTANGRASFGLPAGEYTIYAGRGFEYSTNSFRLSLEPGEKVQKQLTIRREVPTDGYVSCDTHIHTLTYSGHGDATIDERVITLAGEGIELPIATDHNRHIDYDAVAKRHDVRRFFTPVVGNEVTTSVGHYNIFPVAVDGAVPEYQLKDGNAVLDSIAQRTRAKAIVLNHPRDLHLGFRPFDPERHNAATGANSATWLMRVQAMELVNSGAQQTDPLQTYRDWFALLNRGVNMTPVGASDSHDVSRFIVGQARTYIRCRDDQPEKINVDEAVDSFLAGRVVVSCGLFVEMTVDDHYRAGDIAPIRNEAHVAVQVIGPAWTTASNVTLFANGVPIREAKISDRGQSDIKWSGHWTIPANGHDVYLVAVATGPGVTGLYWPIAKPYQPTSPEANRRVIGSTGAIWLDCDGDGKRTSALDYAGRLLEKHNKPIEVVQELTNYDEAVAIQAAGLLQAKGIALDGDEFQTAIKTAGPQVERGFSAYEKASRTSEIAQAKAK